jgi:hypothetical protein
MQYPRSTFSAAIRKPTFDTVNRQKILQRLQETGIQNKLMSLIKMAIQHTRAGVIAENLKTYCNVFVGSISRWNFITLTAQYTTLDYNQQLL